jgi:hypothetical protein
VAIIPKIPVPAPKQKARDHVAKMLKRIRKAHENGQQEKARGLVCGYLASHDAHHLAALEAYNRVRVDLRPDPKLLPKIAQSLNPWVGTPEVVQLRLVQKPHKPDDFRTIVNFGVKNRALQYLVRDVLEAQADLHPNQYAMRGHHAAIERVADLLEQDCQWAIETDIANCYQSFDGEKVSELLPIPKKVTQSTLLGEHLTLTLLSGMFGSADPGVEDETVFPEEFAAARLGLPQGSAASSLVAEMLLASLFDELPDGSRMIGYADNFLVMGKSKNDVLPATLALWSALDAHPAGQFQPNVPRIYKPGDPIDFLGHRLQLCKRRVRIDPIPKKTGGIQNRDGYPLTRNYKGVLEEGTREEDAQASWLCPFMDLPIQTVHRYRQAPGCRDDAHCCGFVGQLAVRPGPQGFQLATLDIGAGESARQEHSAGMAGPRATIPPMQPIGGDTRCRLRLTRLEAALVPGREYGSKWGSRVPAEVYAGC